MGLHLRAEMDRNADVALVQRPALVSQGLAVAPMNITHGNRTPVSMLQKYRATDTFAAPSDIGPPQPVTHSDGDAYRRRQRRRKP